MKIVLIALAVAAVVVVAVIVAFIRQISNNGWEQ